MTDATTVLRDARAAIAENEQRIREHRYLADLAAGRVSTEALRAFPGTQYHLWKSNVRSVAGFVSRFGDRSYAGFFVGNLQAEIASGKGIVAIGRKLGMTENDLERYTPTGQGFAYAAYFAWLAQYGSAAEVACGLCVNLAAWGHNCGEMSRSLHARYGFGPEDTGVLDRFGDIPPLDDAALEIIRDDLDHGVPPQRIVLAASLIQSYEVMFWDAMAAA